MGSGAARGAARGVASGVGANIGGGGMKLLAVGRGEVRGAGKAVDMDDSNTLSSASCNGRQHASQQPQQAPHHVSRVIKDDSTPVSSRSRRHIMYHGS